MRHPRKLVLSGCLGALIVMTVLSAVVGMPVPNLGSPKRTHHIEEQTCSNIPTKVCVNKLHIIPRVFKRLHSSKKEILMNEKLMEIDVWRERANNAIKEREEVTAQLNAQKEELNLLREKQAKFEEFMMAELGRLTQKSSESN